MKFLCCHHIYRSAGGINLPELSQRKSKDESVASENVQQVYRRLSNPRKDGIIGEGHVPRSSDERRRINDIDAALVIN